MKPLPRTLSRFISALLLSSSALLTPARAEIQTLTVLGANGSAGSIDTFSEASRDQVNWGPAYLFTGHPWGNVTGTNAWLNFDPDPAAGVGTDANHAFTYYRIRFVAPASWVGEPEIAIQMIADNRGHATLNSTFLGTIDGSGSFSPPGDALVPGVNTLYVTLEDWGGINGINYRIDISVDSDDGFILAEVTDTDVDGLNSDEETALGTDPDNPDTDGDGVLDGVDPNPLDAQPELEARIAALEQQLSDCDDLVALLQQTLDDRDASITGLSSDLATAQAQATSLAEQLSLCQAHKVQLETQLDEAAAHLVALNAQLDTAVGANAALQAQLDAANATVAGLQADLTHAVAQIASLEGQLADSQAQVASLETQLAAANAANAQLTADLAAAQNQIATLEGELQAATAQIAGLHSELQAAHANIAALQSELQAATARIAELENSLILALQENASLQAQLADTQAQLADTAAQLAQCMADKAALEAALQVAEDTIAAQQQQITDLTLDLEAAFAVIADLQTVNADQAALLAAVSGDLSAYEAFLRQTFRDPDFQIAGATPAEKVAHLVAALLEVNRGRNLDIYRELGGRVGHGHDDRDDHDHDHGKSDKKPSRKSEKSDKSGKDSGGKYTGKGNGKGRG